MNSTTRRDFLQGTATYTLLAAAAAGVAATGIVQAAEGAAGSAASGGPAPGSLAAAPAWSAPHEPVPLPFEARSLKGISEKLIRSHHENNYTGAVKVEGLGFDNPDITPLFDPALGTHTYQFVLREPMKGSIIFSSEGGDGSLDLFDISGFKREPL